ncbi:MAG: hypothetical protein ACI9YT_002645 [Halobacteriales archaeon]|jgi:hypothetical protein
MMSLVASESLGELLGLVLSALGSIAFTVAGTIAEQAAVHHVLAGRPMLGAWEAWMGTIALVVGVWVLGYQRLWPRLSEFRNAA